jgi:phosphatidate cytidylyltransferase
VSARAARGPAPRRDRRRRSDLGARVAVAIPAAIYAIFIVTSGGLVFAIGLMPLGAVALRELYTLMRRARPVDLAGYMTLVAMLLLALYEERADVMIALLGAIPLVFLLALVRPRLENVAWGIAATMFGITWICLPLAHAIFLRELPHGDGLLIDVLVATFIGDTVAYAAGRMWGQRPLAPDISPNKTVEGLVWGAAGAIFAFWCAGLYQDWLSGIDALFLGVLVAVSAPVGDLFESVVKRDLEVKDTGRFFGVHGGVLDRLDAVLFTVPLTFYAALALGYG